jgi:adenylate kinase family enzyme
MKESAFANHRNRPARRARNQNPGYPFGPCRSGGPYLYENAPKKGGFCDLDHTALIQRPDDTAQILNERFEVHAALTAPVIEYFRIRRQLIDAAGDMGGSNRLLKTFSPPYTKRWRIAKR